MLGLTAPHIRERLYERILYQFKGQLLHNSFPTYRICAAVVHLHAVDLEGKHCVGFLRKLNVIAFHELLAILQPTAGKGRCIAKHVCRKINADRNRLTVFVMIVYGKSEQ